MTIFCCVYVDHMKVILGAEIVGCAHEGRGARFGDAIVQDDCGFSKIQNPLTLTFKMKIKFLFIYLY